MYFLSDGGGWSGSQDWCCEARGPVATVDYADMRGLEVIADGS
jgi:hypothetical protein